MIAGTKLIRLRSVSDASGEASAAVTGRAGGQPARVPENDAIVPKDAAVAPPNADWNFGEAGPVEASLREPAPLERVAASAGALWMNSARRASGSALAAGQPRARRSRIHPAPAVTPAADSPPLVEGAQPTLEPAGGSTNTRLASFTPTAADMLAPKPAVSGPPKPAATSQGGDLMINANSQTDFTVDERRIVFAGSVSMRNDRFFLTSDRVVAYMKKESQGLDFAEAQGNVVVRLIENDQETGSTGTARTAVYHPATGEIVLRGWPKIQSGNKAHVASTATTEMSLFTDGRMKTSGRNQTVILR